MVLIKKLLICFLLIPVMYLAVVGSIIWSYLFLFYAIIRSWIIVFYNIGRFIFQGNRIELLDTYIDYVMKSMKGLYTFEMSVKDQLYFTLLAIVLFFIILIPIMLLTGY